MGEIDIGYGVAIPDDAFVVTASRSSGPGGQHVNKTSTRVTVTFDVANSDRLTEYQKRRILHVAGKRASGEGVIRISDQSHRSQLRNRDEAIARMTGILREALEPQPVRKRTGIPKSAREQRLRQKKRRSEIKKERGPVEV